MDSSPTNHQPRHASPEEMTRSLPGADLADAARAGVEAIVRRAMVDIHAAPGLAEATFVAAGDSDRLPSPDGERSIATVPVICPLGCPCECDGRNLVPETLGWLAAPGVDESVLRPWAEWLARWLGLATTIERLREMAYSDELTAAGNRRAFERFLPQAIMNASEKGRPLALMVFDIDNFKRYNDEFGHDAGDAVLVETVALLRAVIRRGDRVFRIGGDEFVVVFADPEGQRAVGAGHIESVDQLVKRFRQRVAELSLPQLGHSGPGTVTISAGLSTYPWDGSDGPSLVAHADRLALESKRRGKNLITFGPGARENVADAGPMI